MALSSTSRYRHFDAMHFLRTIVALVLAVQAAASAIPAQKRASPGGGVCTSSDFEPVTTVGNSAGTPFCESKWGTSYLPITTITTWSDSSYVLGIQVTYSDGSESPVYGYTTGLNEMSISVAYSHDNITILDLYQDLGYPYINALYVATKSGQIMNAGESVVFFPTEYTQQVGTGILFGVSGTIDPSNGYLYSLGFQFLNSVIESIDVSDLMFTNLPVGDEDITPQTVDTGAFQNNQSSGVEMWSFKNTHEVTNTYTFELQFTETFSPSEAIEFGTSGDVPGVDAKSTTTFEWTLSAEESLTLTYTVTNTLEWDLSGSLSPGQGVACVAVYGQGVGNFPFNSTVTVNLQSGSSFSFEEVGVLKVDDASNMQAECSDDNNTK